MIRAAWLVAAFVAIPIVAEAQQPCTNDPQTVISEIYQRVLERPPDEGAGGWVNDVRDGESSIRDIVGMVAKSPEYTHRFLSGDPRDGVTDLYRKLLGREPDIGRLADYAGAAAKGWNPVIDAIIGSREYTRFAGDNGVPGTNVRYCGSVRSPFRTSGATRTPGTFARTSATFNSLDRNRDGRVSASEWRYDTESFVRADRNGDDVLTRAEFLAPDDTSFDDEDDRFGSLDTNGNGRIERSEWRASADAFTWLDRDGNGVLNRAEVVGPEAAREQFTALDVDGDDRLSVREWPWSRQSFTQQDTNRDGLLTRQEFVRAAAPTR